MRIALFEPDIPQNTGAIARTAATQAIVFGQDVDPDASIAALDAVTFDDWKPEWLFLDADGNNNGKGGRVKRCMPRLVPWTAQATIYIVDEVITKDVLTRILTDAGLFVGERQVVRRHLCGHR